MDVYKKMYLRLFNQVTDSIELLRRGCPSEAEKHLVAAQQECEEIFMDNED